VPGRFVAPQSLLSHAVRLVPHAVKRRGREETRSPPTGRRRQQLETLGKTRFFCFKLFAFPFCISPSELIRFESVRHNIQENALGAFFPPFVKNTKSNTNTEKKKERSERERVEFRFFLSFAVVSLLLHSSRSSQKMRKKEKNSTSTCRLSAPSPWPSRRSASPQVSPPRSTYVHGKRGFRSSRGREATRKKNVSEWPKASGVVGGVNRASIAHDLFSFSRP